MNSSLEYIKQVIDECGLTEREKIVLKMRLGINVGRSQALEEIGQQFKVTRERIRQIEAKALRKLSGKRRKNEQKT